MVLYRDVLAAANRQVLQRADARRKHTAHKRNTGNGRVAEVQARQARAIGRNDLLEQGIKRVGLGRPLSAVGRLVARRAHGDCGLRQAKGQCLPCQWVIAQEVAQVAGCVVEVEQGGGGYLGEQRLQDRRIGGHDGLEQAEGRRIVGGRWLFAGSCAGAGDDSEGAVVLLLRAHASRPRRGLRRKWWW